MTEFYQLNFGTADSIAQFRSKVLLFTQKINYPDMDAVRIATVASDLSRWLYNNSQNLQGNICLDEQDERLYLVIKFYFSSNAIKQVHHSFPQFSLSELDGKKVLSVHEPVLDNQFQLSDAEVEKLRIDIISMSEDELLSEVNNKNKELQTLITRLQHSSTVVQSEKMQALGTLTAGVAHELNNPLMSLLNFIQYCIKHRDDPDKILEPLKDAENEIKRCADIVHNLLTFSRLEEEGVESFKPVDCNLLIARVLDILAYRIRSEKIFVQKALKEQLPKCDMQENKFQQIILNLITNALDAMKETSKKTLAITTDVKTGHLIIKISDTGVGIKSKIQDQVFQPFFTTKPVGKGTGLGLSVSNGIIQDHHGKLTFDSEENKGSTFIVSLPLRFS